MKKDKNCRGKQMYLRTASVYIEKLYNYTLGRLDMLKIFLLDKNVTKKDKFTWGKMQKAFKKQKQHLEKLQVIDKTIKTLLDKRG